MSNFAKNVVRWLEHVHLVQWLMEQVGYWGPFVGWWRAIVSGLLTAALSLGAAKKGLNIPACILLALVAWGSVLVILGKFKPRRAPAFNGQIDCVLHEPLFGGRDGVLMTHHVFIRATLLLSDPLRNWKLEFIPVGTTRIDGPHPLPNDRHFYKETASTDTFRATHKRIEERPIVDLAAKATQSQPGEYISGWLFFILEQPIILDIEQPSENPLDGEGTMVILRASNIKGVEYSTQPEVITSGPWSIGSD